MSKEKVSFKEFEERKKMAARVKESLKQTLRISLNIDDERFFSADFCDESAEHLAYERTPEQATVEALAVWGLQADDVNIVYDSTCHISCDTKCLVPATPLCDCPAAATH